MTCHRVTLRKNRCARKKLLNYYFASYSRAEIETERNMEGRERDIAREREMKTERETEKESKRRSL